MRVVYNGIEMEVVGVHETPVYDTDGKTILYDNVTLRLKAPHIKICPWCRERYTEIHCPLCHPPVRE